MKLTKKIISLLLVLMMVAALAVPVMAADYTITITNPDATASAGHKYDAYQILAGKLDSTGKILTEITWGQNVTDADAFLAALKAEPGLVVGGNNIFASATTAADVAGVLSQPANQTSAILSAFAKVATAKISGSPVASSAQGDAPYTITIPEAKAGYYLVKDDPSALAGQTNKDVSDYILQVVGNVTVEHKGSIPTVDKQVSETGDTYHDSILSGINQENTYRLPVELPDDYNKYDTYYLELSDKMSKELTYIEITKVYVVIRSSDTRMDIHPDDYTVSVTSIADDAPKMPGGTHLEIEFEDLKTIRNTSGTLITLTPEDAICVVYKAKINDKAIVTDKGIPNEVTLTYSNDPNSNGKGTTNTEEAHVYPLNMELVKKDGKDSTALAGAKFVLSRVYNDGLVTRTQYAKLDANKKMNEWVDHYEGDGCAAGDPAHEAAVSAGKLGTVLLTGADGKINVYGLDAGNYSLVEIQAPDGYNKLVDSVKFSVNATINEETDTIASMTGTTGQGNITFDPATATVKLEIPNYKGNVLPSTGGIGTTLFYVLGGIMVLCAGVVLITKKRMAAN